MICWQRQKGKVVWRLLHCFDASTIALFSTPVINEFTINSTKWECNFYSAIAWSSRFASTRQHFKNLIPNAARWKPGIAIEGSSFHLFHLNTLFSEQRLLKSDSLSRVNTLTPLGEWKILWTPKSGRGELKNNFSLVFFCLLHSPEIVFFFRSYAWCNNRCI